MHPGEVWSHCTDWLTSRYRKAFFFLRSDKDLRSFATLHLTSKWSSSRPGSDVYVVYDPTPLAWHRVESCLRHTSRACRQGFVESLFCSTKHRQMFESPGFKWISASLLCGGVSSALLSSRAYLHEGCMASELTRVNWPLNSKTTEDMNSFRFLFSTMGFISYLTNPPFSPAARLRLVLTRRDQLE